MSGITDLTYTAVTTTTASVSLEVESRVAPVAGGADYKLEYWVNLDATSEPQIDTVTVSQANLPSADAHYQVTIDGPTGGARVFSLFYDQSAAPSESDIAADLAELVNLHPDIAAGQGGTGAEDTVICTANIPGTDGAFTLTVDCLLLSDGTSASPVAISTANTAMASGTGQVRKLSEVTVGPVIDANKKLAVQVKSGNHFNGGASPTSVSTISSSSFTHPSTMDAIRAAQA